MDAFLGSWVLVSSENFEEYMQAIGFHQEMLQIGSLVKPVISISQEGDKVVVKTTTSVSSTEISFVLGEEFDENADIRQCKSVVTIEGDKLVHVQKWDDKSSTLTREIRGDQHIVTLQCGDVVAVRTYERTSI